MRLALASVDAFPRLGGVSSLGHHLANSLVDLGHQVVFVGPRGTHVPREHLRSYRLVEDWESQTHHRSGEAALPEDRRIEELFERVIARHGAERLLLLHPFYYGIGAWRAAKAAGIPCSTYFHGYELRSQLRGQYPRRHRQLVDEIRIHTLRERVLYLIAVADEILTNSHYTASLFEPFAIKPSVRSTGCGIPGSVFARERHLTPSYDRKTKAQRRRELGLPRQTCLAYVGRLVPAKRVDRLLQLCRENRDLSAVVVGEGPDGQRLQRLAARLGVDERVAFCGAVSETRKWEILRATDFLCLLSQPDEKEGQVEGFGIALLEGAAAAAVPVSSGTGGMSDVVDHRHTGLVIPPDDRAAAEVLRRIGSDEIEMQALVDGARTQLERHYTWHAVAHRMVEPWTS